MTFNPTNLVSADNAIGDAMHRSRSHDAVIRVYDDAGNVIETQKHKGEFRDWSASHVNKKPPRCDA